jgi:ubiquinone biosynthesis protein COQ4
MPTVARRAFANLHKVQPLEAARGFANLLRDPEDTTQAFRIVHALDGGHIERLHRRFRRHPEGARLLDERPELLELLSDVDRLAAMPAGSVGRAYLAYCEAQGITPGGLVEASDDDVRRQLPPELLWLSNRLRDQHDLWHLLLGAHTDVVGELCVLTFSTAQTGGVGVAALALVGYLKSFELPAEDGAKGRGFIRHAWEAGRMARWLPVTRWEDLFHLPLEEVRRQLGVVPLPAYEPYAYPPELEAA